MAAGHRTTMSCELENKAESLARWKRRTRRLRGQALIHVHTTELNLEAVSWRRRPWRTSKDVHGDPAMADSEGSRGHAARRARRGRREEGADLQPWCTRNAGTLPLREHGFHGKLHRLQPTRWTSPRPRRHHRAT
jgi:hypothetical protein